MQRFLRFCNENHQYLLAASIIAVLAFWTWGCESECKSLLDDSNKINRLELAAEIEYLARIADSRIADLDKQDEIKQQLLDTANIISTGGQINPSGLINLAATIGAISFGLNRNKQLKNVRENTNKNT